MYVVKLPEELLKLINKMIEMRASDLLLLPGEPPAYRLTGRRIREDAPPLSRSDISGLAGQVFGEEALVQLGSEQGTTRGVSKVNIDPPVNGSGERRIITTVSLSDVGYVLSVRPCYGDIPLPEVIGIPESVLKVAGELKGLMVVSGPTGSGKSTAAATVMEYLNANRNCHICIIGDPVEIELEPKQAMVQNIDAGSAVPDVLSGIETAWRLDADAVFVSEIGTAEELQMCLAVALTGHFVITVVHGSSPDEVFERMTGLISGEHQSRFRLDMAEALCCLVNMRLYKKADGNGRAAAYGVIVPDESMRQALARGKELNDGQSVLPVGSQSLTDSVRELVGKGVVPQSVLEQESNGLW